MSLKIKKTYLDNPFTDSLLFYIKTLAYGCIIKSEVDATAGETMDSIRNAELYIYAMENGADFNMYTYTEQMLVSVLSPGDLVHLNLYLKHKSAIPDIYRPILIKKARKEVIDNYVETNNYYRMICGLPDFGDRGIAFAPYSYLLPPGEDVIVPYIHEMGPDGAKMLEMYGIMDKIRADHPKAKYLDYISAGIPIYKARKCIDKQILYMPSSGNADIDDLFQEKYELVRTFVRRRVDSTAMEYESEHYQGFLTSFIFFITMLELITEVQDRIIKKDMLDARCIAFIYETYGVPYYKKIPLRYQIMMCKNINSLVQYKSSPTDMIAFIHYFGANSINIYKYYLLRDRNMDPWGNYIYIMKTVMKSIHNDILAHKTRTAGPNDPIPYPFEYYLNKGNLMYPWVGNHRLSEIEYDVHDYDKITVKNPDYQNQPIRYEFYYDKNTEFDIFTPNTKDSIKTHVQVIENLSSKVKTITLEPPSIDYLQNDNELLVIVGSTILDRAMYEISLADTTLTFNGTFDLAGKRILIVYFHGASVKTKFVKTHTVATSNGQKTFAINEPFPNYLLNGNQYFVTIGSTYIEDDRYEYSATNKTIIFTDGTSLLKGRRVTFNFIYSLKSVYSNINIFHLEQTLTAEEPFQIVFQMNDNVKKYVDFGYNVFVEIRGWYIEARLFEVYGNTIAFKDHSIGLQPGESFKVHLYYGPIAENLATYTECIGASENMQEVFKINFPVDKYFEKGNKIVVDSAGYPLTEGVHYHIDGDKIVITDDNIKPRLGERVSIQYVYNIESDYAIRVMTQNIPVTTNNQREFFLTLPFYPYFETGHGCLIIHNSVVVDPKFMKVERYKMTLDIDCKQGDMVTILYVFNNKYMTERNSVIKVKKITVPSSEVDDNYIMKMPVPFDDFIENEWPWFVDTEQNYIDPNTYDVFSNGLVFNDAPSIKDKPSYTFFFMYKDIAPWVTKEQSEDFDNDIDMKFLKLPLTAFTDTDTYIKLKEKVKSYDAVTLEDKFWDGEDGHEYANELHASIKSAIAKQKFNYARTKYMSLNYLIDIAEVSFQIPYFYNMLYDDVFTEERLTVSIPKISPYHQFKLSHVFCYMTALAYLFKGIEDTIMRSPTQIMCVKGFNFKADMDALKEWILDIRRRPEDYKEVFDFINKTTEYNSIEEFINTYQTNKKVFKAIVENMFEARNYDIHMIWKKMYDSLMIWQFNLDFFKLSNGEVAPTFTEFLKEKDRLLYNSIKRIESMGNRDAMEEEIINMIQDIVYILEEYIDSKEFRYIYMHLPGMSPEHLLEYLFTMINFFKSYKVVLFQMGVEWMFTDKNLMGIRPYDVINMKCNLDKLDYIAMKERKLSQTTTEYHDKISETWRDKISIKYRWD
nr:MAG TPA: hypothetical protein [Caudoviricetes sp.]